MNWLRRQILREPFGVLIFLPVVGALIAARQPWWLELPLGAWFFVVTMVLDEQFGIHAASTTHQRNPGGRQLNATDTNLSGAGK